VIDFVNQAEAQSEVVGRELHQLAAQLFPLHRSITGEGVRQTLRTLRQHVPLEMHEVPTGREVFDFSVPQEWNIRDAFIKDADGERIVDYQKSNLHIVNYSQPVQATMPWHELRDHVFTLPEHPDWIPYRTSYFRPTWGFCLSHRQYEQLEQTPDREYEVCIDATLTDGSLTYGEFYLPGQIEDEVLISCHVCHPSLANDNLSGIAIATQLAKHLQDVERRFSYRFIFIPATIGAIAWLSMNQARTTSIKHGLILSLLGDAGNSTYKKSRRGDAEIDRAVELVLKHSGQDYSVVDFEPTGYDERQFCSPGFNLPVGCLMRTPNSCFPEYHTSADNLDFIQPMYLADSWSKCLAIIDVLENNITYVNQKPYGEPQLGKYGLYKAFGEQDHAGIFQKAVLWILNLSDGRHDLLSIAERAGLAFAVVREAALLLAKHELLKPVVGEQGRVPSTSLGFGFSTEHSSVGSIR